MKAWMSLNFGKFATELRPLIDVRIWFLLNILKTNSPIKTKGPRMKSYSICLDFKRLYLGPCIINKCIFCA